MISQVIVAETKNPVVVTENNNTVVVEHARQNIVVSGMIGPIGVSALSGLSDMDLQNLSAGSVLVYNAGTEKWTSTKLLDQQIVDSGQF
jgi:phage FluMu protein gp41